MQNQNSENIVLKKDEYNTLLEQLVNVNNRINELMKAFSLSKDISKNNTQNTEIEDGLKEEIKNLRANNKLSQKQYQVLSYMLDNKYHSDMNISKITGISYSSLSQWKRNDSYFKELYRKILLLKTI